MDGLGLGLLKIRVQRGIDLVPRDKISSDPYVTIQYGSQKVKTRAVKDTCNPVWDEELTICIEDPDVPIVLSVHDRDTFTGDDFMGDAEIDIKAGSTEVGGGCGLVRDVFLKLRNVQTGGVQIQLRWIHLPSSPSPSPSPAT